LKRRLPLILASKPRPQGSTALTELKVIYEEHELDGGAVHSWYRTKLVLALVTRTAIDDAFDRFRPYEPDRKRLTKGQGNVLVDALLDSCPMRAR
jgi:hypothetical protein